MRRRSHSSRSHNRESGYTLIELTAVVLVIGILASLAMGSFLRAQGGASSAAAKSRVRMALSAARTYVLNEGTMPSAAADLVVVEPSLQVTPTFDDAAMVLGTVYVQPGAADAITLAAASKDRICFWVSDSLTDGTRYASAECDAPIADLVFTDSW